MLRNLSYYILALIILTFFGFNVYTHVNYKELKDTVSIKEESEDEEINRINVIREKVAKWEEEHYPKIMPDGFNSNITDEIRKSSKPVKGGEVNVHYNSEPKVLIPWIENSATTSWIIGYIYDSLLTRNSESYEIEKALAIDWSEEDVVWLKGKNPENLFKVKEGDNNYLIGKIQYDNIVWEDKKKGLVKQIPIIVNGKTRIIKSNELRYKTNKKEKYTRAFDMGVVFKFKLRKDVKWHDGKDFTSKDVIFTLDTIKNPYIVQLSNIRNYYRDLKNWTAPDDYTVHCYFDKQYFKNLDFISGLSPLPKHIYIDKGQKFTHREFAEEFIKHKSNRKPIGTGPYFFPSELISKKYKNDDSYWKDKRLILLRNDNYFLPEKKGYLEKLIFHFIEKQEVALVEFRSGKLDLGSLKPVQFYKTTNTDEYKSKYVKAIYYTPVYSFFGFNMKKIFFRDKRVRKAFTMLLDRERINKNLLYGMGKNVTGNQYYFSKYYNRKLKPLPFDRKKARELISEAGWIDTDGDGIRDKHGVPFEFTLIYPAGSSGKDYAYFLVEELEDIGIKMNLTQLEWSVYLEHLRDHKFDMSVLAWVSSPNEGDGYQVWHSSQWANKGSNFVGFDNKEADELLEKIRRTLDPDERLKMHHRFHEILYEEQPYLFLFISPARGMYSNRFRNVKFYRSPPGYNLAEWYVPLELQKNRRKSREAQ